jgi:pimeloyl-ACP methyl ester carboxylesterase
VSPHLHWPGPRPAAPSAVLLHGLTSSSRTWRDLGAHLSDRFEVYAPDQRGHGSGPRAPRHEYTIDDFAQDAITLVEALGLRRPLLIGHSLGGAAALTAAAELFRQSSQAAPAALILEDPVHAMGTERQRELAERMRQLQALDTDGLRAELLKAEPTLTPDQLDTRVDELRATDGGLLAEMGCDTAERSLLPLFADVECPVLLVLADTALSRVFDDEILAQARPLLPAGSRAVRLEGTPHTVHRAAAQRVAREIDEFLETVF